MGFIKKLKNKMHLALHKAIVNSLLKTVCIKRDKYFYETLQFIHENMTQCLSRISPRFLISTSYPHYNWWVENTNPITADFVKEFFSEDFWTSSEMNEIDIYLTWQFLIDYLLFIIKETERLQKKEILSGDNDELITIKAVDDDPSWIKKQHTFWNNHLIPIYSLLINDHIRTGIEETPLPAPEFWIKRWDIYIRRNSINTIRSPRPFYKLNNETTPENNNSVKGLQEIIDLLSRGENPTLNEGDYIKYSNSLKQWYVSSE